ncbi:hypothetical protein MNBD_GAMMA11-2205 [hydrothermal vent metagenome]|uniref:Uncharacterized protein n=1 Tax=hydrothermal vent metagenome TaxID=652676 RepID=A0A3B0X9B3_9ZZZZ
MQTDNVPFNNDQSADLRDVTSTARLFNFRRPVYMASGVWADCVELQLGEGEGYDDLAVLQRLRHVLFMAASALHGRVEDLQYDFRIYRVMNGALHGQRQPEPVNLHLSAHKDEHNRPVITISFPVK